eukprot:scaffold6661_cov109-Cylindrotheca_fusiformis.AAC.6
MSNFKSILFFHLKFTKVPHAPELHTYLNYEFEDVIPDHERLYTDPNEQDTVLADFALDSTIRKIIAEEMIKPYATLTSDLSCIDRIINAALLKVYDPYLCVARRLTKQSFTNVLTLARDKTAIKVQIQISTMAMFYDISKGPPNCLDWSSFSNSPLSQTRLSSTPSSQPLTPMDIIGVAIAVEVKNALNPGLSAVEIAMAWLSEKCPEVVSAFKNATTS